MSSIGVIDRLCKIIILQTDLIQEQASLIEQHQIMDELEGKREELREKLNEISSAISLSHIDRICKQKY